MNTASSVTTKKVASQTSRARRDVHMVRQQFEDWLADMADDNDIGRATRLNELFERSTLTRQRDLADAVGVELRTVQRWLQGGAISKTYWDTLAGVLDTTVKYLIFGEEDEPLDPSQLDRIEGKLDELLDLLRSSPSDGLERELGATASRKRRPGGSSDEAKRRRRSEG